MKNRYLRSKVVVCKNILKTSDVIEGRSRREKTRLFVFSDAWWGQQAPDVHEQHHIDRNIMADTNKRKSGPGDSRDDKHGKRSKVRRFCLAI